jgi:hypothetical protein
MRGVLKLQGRPHFAMVSEWMKNGNIRSFVVAHRNADRYKLVRLPAQLAVLISNDLVSTVDRRR